MTTQTNVGTVEKQPSEITDTIGVGFGGHLASGESISAASVTVSDEQGNDVTATLLHDLTYTDTEVQFRIKAGEHGKRYVVTIVANLSNGSIPEREVTILVADNTFASSDLSFSVGDIIPRVTEIIGTTVETGPLRSEDKISAIFWAYHELLTTRKPEEAFQSDWMLYLTERKGSLPPNYLVWVKVFDPDDATKEYRRISVNEFDQAEGYYWTVRKDAYGQDKLVIARDATAVKIRYLANPTTFSSVNDIIRLPKYYQQTIAFMAAAKLSSNARDYADAAAKMREADRYMEQSGGVHAEQQRHASQSHLSSIYNETSLFDEHA